MLFLFLFTIFLNHVAGTVWNSNNYPNPVIDYQNCSMNYSSQICDPDNVLQNSDNRITINEKLKWLKNATSKSDKDGCSGKGITAVVIVGNRFQGDSLEVKESF